MDTDIKLNPSECSKGKEVLSVLVCNYIIYVINHQVKARKELLS